jgi:hypothetical protein
MTTRWDREGTTPPVLEWRHGTSTGKNGTNASRFRHDINARGLLEERYNPNSRKPTFAMSRIVASTGAHRMRTGARAGAGVGMRAHLTTVLRPRPRATGRATQGRSATTRAARECTRLEVEVAGARRRAAQGAAMAAMVGTRS